MRFKSSKHLLATSLFILAKACTAAQPTTDEGAQSSDLKATAVPPSLCEGKVFPVCVEFPTGQYQKVYDKYDRTTCKILDKREPVVSMDLCAIPAEDEAKAKSFLPAGVEILRVEKGQPDGQTIYRISYRATDEFLQKLFREDGKELPVETRLEKYAWVEKDLMEELTKEPLDSKPVPLYFSFINSYPPSTLQQSYEALTSAFRESAPATLAKITEAQADGVLSPTLEVPLSVIKEKLDALAPILVSLGFVPLACPAGYPNFCIKKSDGTYDWGDPIIIKVPKQCDRYEAPADAVDNSFCKGL